MQHVRSDDGGESREGKISDVCREHCIKQALPSTNSPAFSGVADRSYEFIDIAGLAARINALDRYGGRRNLSAASVAFLSAELFAWAGSYAQLYSDCSQPRAA